MTPTALTRLGRRILEIVDPERFEAEEARVLAEAEKRAGERQRLCIRALGDGTSRITAVVPDATAARLATYLHAFTNPRLSDGVHGGDATHVMVTIPYETLTRGLGTATIDNQAPGDGHDTITAAQARRLACTARILPPLHQGPTPGPGAARPDLQGRGLHDPRNLVRGTPPGVVVPGG